ncbi:MAG TPA: MerR family DNA-binding transcriptional regulator, partial [Streptosporangiaceae bacterium]|nr:MerR family DNA-binding transcriptional regulator [Streptosporangiaceae bacterium]
MARSCRNRKLWSILHSQGNCPVLIGEAARRAGVSRDTVRLYTRLGLVACTSRLAGSRAYADYDEDAVE